MSVRRSPRGALVGVMLALSACGGAAAGAGASTAWRAQHPDPANARFDRATGLCAVTVRYPEEAPGLIEYGGDMYVQTARAEPHPPAGPVVATSGDWRLYAASPGALDLLTPSALFVYRAGAQC